MKSKTCKYLCMLLLSSLVSCGSSYQVEVELVPHINKVDNRLYTLVVGIPLGGIDADFEYDHYSTNMLDYGSIIGVAEEEDNIKELPESKCTVYNEEGNEIYYKNKVCIVISPTKEGIEKIKDEDYILTFRDANNQVITSYKTKLLKDFDFTEILEDIE